MQTSNISYKTALLSGYMESQYCCEVMTMNFVINLNANILGLGPKAKISGFEGIRLWSCASWPWF